MVATKALGYIANMRVPDVRLHVNPIPARSTYTRHQLNYVIY